MTAHLSNKFFIYLLMTQDTFPLNKANIIKHFILNQYVIMVC